MKQHFFRLPWPPTENHLYTVARGRKILSKAGRAYKEAAGQAIREQFNGEKLWFDRLDVTVILRAPHEKAYDIGNFRKSIEDVLKEQGVYRDDSQIDKLLILRGPKMKPGFADVTVTSRWD